MRPFSGVNSTIVSLVFPISTNPTAFLPLSFSHEHNMEYCLLSFCPPPVEFVSCRAAISALYLNSSIPISFVSSFVKSVLMIHIQNLIFAFLIPYRFCRVAALFVTVEPFPLLICPVFLVCFSLVLPISKLYHLQLSYDILLLLLFCLLFRFQFLLFT